MCPNNGTWLTVLGIFNVCTDVDTCDCTWGCKETQESLDSNLTWNDLHGKSNLTENLARCLHPVTDWPGLVHQTGQCECSAPPSPLGQCLYATGTHVHCRVSAQTSALAHCWAVSCMQHSNTLQYTQHYVVHKVQVYIVCMHPQKSLLQQCTGIPCYMYSHIWEYNCYRRYKWTRCIITDEVSGAHLGWAKALRIKGVGVVVRKGDSCSTGIAAVIYRM